VAERCSRDPKVVGSATARGTTPTNTSEGQFQCFVFLCRRRNERLAATGDNPNNYLVAPGVQNVVEYERKVGVRPTVTDPKSALGRCCRRNSPGVLSR
jgi:hypothetical protein